MYLNAVLPISTFFFMNITVKTVHICRFTDSYYLWNDRFSVLSWKFCPFKGFLDLLQEVNRVKGPAVGKADHDIVNVEYKIKAKRIQQAP